MLINKVIDETMVETTVKQLFIYLCEKGIINEEDFIKAKKEWDEKLKLRHILTPEEIRELQECLKHYTKKAPRSWAEAMVGGKSEIDREYYGNADRVFSYNDLNNLVFYLKDGGLKNENIIEKLVAAKLYAERHDIRWYKAGED